MTPEDRLELLVKAERAQTPSRARAEQGLERLQRALSANVPPIDIGPVDPTLLAGSTTAGKLVAGKLATLPWLAKATAVVAGVVTTGALVGNQMAPPSAPARTPVALTNAPATAVSSTRAARGLAPISESALPAAPGSGRRESAPERLPAEPRSKRTLSSRERAEAKPEARRSELPSSPVAEASASVRAFEDAPATQAAPAQSFDAELVLIKRAKAEFDRGHDQLARVWLDAHAQRFPAGVFAAEREGLSVLSICRSNPALGQTTALAFLQRYPQSPLAARIRHTCQLE